jgi:hypothetical protein
MYQPGAIPARLEELPAFLARELQEISRRSQLVDYIVLDTLYAAPKRIVEGMIVKADGATWNPGQGAGTYERVNSAWVKLGNPTESIIVACSDETTALTTGTGKVTFRMPYAFTLTDLRASLTTAQTSGTIFTVDVNESGTTIISTKLTIDNTEKTTTTAATPRVISDTSIASDAEISIDIDQIGDGTAKGLKVELIGWRT